MKLVGISASEAFVALSFWLSFGKRVSYASTSCCVYVVR
jgi:hypothetical protein